jgi:hypothetical protein
MYYDDHGHPHFHARHADAQAKVRIDRVEVIESSLTERHLRLAELHRSSWSEGGLAERSLYGAGVGRRSRRSAGGLRARLLRAMLTR